MSHRTWCTKEAPIQLCGHKIYLTHRKKHRRVKISTKMDLKRMIINMQLISRTAREYHTLCSAIWTLAKAPYQMSFKMGNRLECHCLWDAPFVRRNLNRRVHSCSMDAFILSRVLIPVVNVARDFASNHICRSIWEYIIMRNHMGVSTVPDSSDRGLFWTR